MSGRMKLTCIPAFLVIITLIGISCGQSPAGSQEDNRRIAEEFMKSEATFQFDGIPDTLEVTSTTAAGDGWKYTIEFDSRHAGLPPDRTGYRGSRCISALANEGYIFTHKRSPCFTFSMREQPRVAASDAVHPKYTSFLHTYHQQS